MSSESRPSRDEVCLEKVQSIAKRGTCIRRRVGCLLTNSRGHTLSDGYNGVPSGWVHCIDTPCIGASYSTGQGLDKCEAIHAEQNALLQCPDVFSIQRCYVTHSPCVSCVKLLLNTSCRWIIFTHEYSHHESKGLWEKAGRKWLRIV